MIGMRARGLLVLDLKAAGALPSSAMAEATSLGSHTIMLTLSCIDACTMHSQNHARCYRYLAAVCGPSQSMQRRRLVPPPSEGEVQRRDHLLGSHVNRMCGVARVIS